jgi:hypothetical protein
MKNMLIAGCISALFSLAFMACGHDAPSVTTATATAGGYICPMNCEKGKTYPQPGTCPVCNMKLEAVKAPAPASKAEYFTAFSSSVTPVEAGKSAVLSFTPKIQGNESALVPLDLVHEKKMHLIVVSDDLSYFDHVHPEFSEGGAYQIKLLEKGKDFTNGSGKNEIRLDKGGQYWAFADYKPTGGMNIADKIELTVNGTKSTPVVYKAEKRVSNVDGFTLSVETSKYGELTTGGHVHLPISIKKDGKPVDPTGFEQYLGEKAHLVLINTETKTFIHTHPMVEDGKLEASTTFGMPGFYRAWLQFQTEGKVHTADFVLKVAEETGKTHDYPHDHSGH